MMGREQLLAVAKVVNTASSIAIQALRRAVRQGVFRLESHTTAADTVPPDVLRDGDGARAERGRGRRE